MVGKLGVAAVTPQELKNAVTGGGAISKIRSVEELKGLLANQQSTGRKVVFTNGCFDLLHTGHIRFLHEARRLGDILVVGLNTDRSVRAVKGASRPILPQEERAAILSALEVVDYVVFFDDLTPQPMLEGLRPDILVKGDTQDHVLGRDRENYAVWCGSCGTIGRSAHTWPRLSRMCETPRRRKQVNGAVAKPRRVRASVSCWDASSPKLPIKRRRRSCWRVCCSSPLFSFRS